MVDWAPQEDVLAHQAICGFLTHNGWNLASDGMFKSIPSGLPANVIRSGLTAKDVFDAMKAVSKPAFRDLLISLDENMDKPIAGIPGFENFLRNRDLPGTCRVKTSDNDYLLQFFIEETFAMTRASALVLNTFEIEAPIVSLLGFHFTKIYAIGPLHKLQKSRMKDINSPSVSSSGILQKEDTSCMTWLNSQPPKSVLYVSFGSLVGLTREQMSELWHGLVNNGQSFLLVVRPDLILGEPGAGETPLAQNEGTEERNRFIVSWALQEEVLAHPAVGGFLTHGGCVSEVSKIGFDMKDTCDGSIIEKLVRDLMENMREEIMGSTDRVAMMARDAVNEGGSSSRNLDRLIENVRLMARKI
ncbi:glycosyltransferase [Citrus sinensis]|nr:glycosyltransferase [Citrus sinensis]